MKKILLSASMVLASLFLFNAPQNAFAKDLTILAAFGTSDSEAQKSLDAIKKAYEKNGDTTIWAFSSNIIRNKLNKDKQVVYSINEALDYAYKNGYNNVKIQSLHVVPGEEYMKICRLISRDMEKNPKRFDSVIMGHPLLSSKADLDTIVKAALASLPKERTKNDAVIFMGHGNDRGTGDLSLIAIAHTFQETDPLAWFATVEGALDFEKTLEKIKEKKEIKNIYLAPFMVVAGDHAKNDMAGTEEDAWAERLKKEGYNVHTLIRGLGEIPEVQKLFIEHTQNSHDDIMNGKIISK